MELEMRGANYVLHECDSNEATVLAILESLILFSTRYEGALVIESDSSNAIAWVLN